LGSYRRDMRSPIVKSEATAECLGRHLAVLLGPPSRPCDCVFLAVNARFTAPSTNCHVLWSAALAAASPCSMMLGLFLWKSQILQQVRLILSFGGESSFRGVGTTLRQAHSALEFVSI
jgi:hypothetical protein